MICVSIWAAHAVFNCIQTQVCGLDLLLCASTVKSPVLHPACPLRQFILMCLTAFKLHMSNLHSRTKFAGLVSVNTDQQPRSYLQCVLNSWTYVHHNHAWCLDSACCLMQSCRLFSSTTYKANTGVEVPLNFCLSELYATCTLLCMSCNHPYVPDGHCSCFVGLVEYCPLHSSVHYWHNCLGTFDC